MTDEKNPFQDIIDEAKEINDQNQKNYSKERIEDINTPDADLVGDYTGSTFNEYYHGEIDEHDDDGETIGLTDEE